MHCFYTLLKCTSVSDHSMWSGHVIHPPNIPSSHYPTNSILLLPFNDNHFLKLTCKSSDEFHILFIAWHLINMKSQFSEKQEVYDVIPHILKALSYRMSHQIAIVFESYYNHMISLNQSKAPQFCFTTVIFSCETFSDTPIDLWNLLCRDAFII